MTITPSGVAPWVRSVGFEDYGGHANKANYQNQGVVNPRTDVGAEAIARMSSDLAAVVRTAAFATITAQCNDSSPAAPTLTVLMQTGVTVSYAGDAAPTGFPSGARVGNGHVTLTFESSYEDDYGVEGAFGIAQALPCLLGTAAGSATANFTVGTQTIDLYGWTSAGAAKSDALISVDIL